MMHSPTNMHDTPCRSFKLMTCAQAKKIRAFLSHLFWACAHGSHRAAITPKRTSWWKCQIEYRVWPLYEAEEITPQIFTTCRWTEPLRIKKFLRWEVRKKALLSAINSHHRTWMILSFSVWVEKSYSRPKLSSPHFSLGSPWSRYMSTREMLRFCQKASWKITSKFRLNH